MKNTRYFLSYDLRNEKNYQKLYDELDKFDAIKILESLYCFKYLDDKTSDLRDHFKGFMDKSDGFIIIKCDHWASYNIDGNPNNL
ncbi:hypothetical protein [Kordia jejudonensis]|uniref:hypothetical protein n=1 Tax=Kordia jejudonensis TaxID=1348245 RepID=UPI00062900D6|nr:hypothetical protein [Kordia jejudonensis]